VRGVEKTVGEVPDNETSDSWSSCVAEGLGAETVPDKSGKNPSAHFMFLKAIVHREGENERVRVQ
jgi:hypothetical protein